MEIRLGPNLFIALHCACMHPRLPETQTLPTPVSNSRPLRPGNPSLPLAFPGPRVTTPLAPGFSSLLRGAFHTGPGKPYPTLEDLWDEDCSYMEARAFERPPGFALR